MSAPHPKLGVVSFLNSRPLIHGLRERGEAELLFDVPSRLATLLDVGRVDLALVPVIDLVQPRRHWSVVSDACIGCDGETFTVRVFSRVPAKQVTRLHVDGDSHTSVMLAQVIWREQFNRSLTVLPYTSGTRSEHCEAILLIGDKVIRHGLIDFDIETDLGSAWKSLTGLPFVFAVWAGRADNIRAEWAGLLAKARDAGVAQAAKIAETEAPKMGWPVELARRYLTRRLQFTMGPRHQEGMRLFLEKTRQYKLVPEGGELMFA